MGQMMINRIRSMIADVRNRRFMDAYLGWILAVAVVIIQVVSTFLVSQNIITTLTTTTTVMLLGIIALATADIRRDIKDGGSTHSWRVFADRSETHPFATGWKPAQQRPMSSAYSLVMSCMSSFPSSGAARARATK